MASPRNHVVRNGETATYHVWSRCVRRAFLCGADPYTGRNFDYRRTWIVKLLEHLAGTFAVNVVNFNVLSNHQHLIASTHPEVARNWSDEEVAWRWKSAWAEWDSEKEVWIATPSDAAIRELLAQPDKVAKARENLSNLSWFVARWKEPIARLANAETGDSGHFWEQRFGARELTDDGAILACSVYVDLNQVKAGLVPSLEESNHSAIQERLRIWNTWKHEQAEASVAKFKGKSRRRDMELSVEDVERLLEGSWLAPITIGGPLRCTDDGVGKLILPASLLETDSQAEHGTGHETAHECAPIDRDLSVSANAMKAEPASMEALEKIVEAQPSTLSIDAGLPGQGPAIQSWDCAPSPGDPCPTPSVDSQIGDDKGQRKKRGTPPEPPTYEIHRRLSARRRKRASDHTAMAVEFDQYIALAIASAVRLGSSDGPLTPELEEVLKKSGIVPEKWMLLLEGFEHRFSRAVGGLESLGPILARLGQQTVRGIQLIRDAFS